MQVTTSNCFIDQSVILYLIRHFHCLRICKKFSCHINLYCRSTKEVLMKTNAPNILRNFIYHKIPLWNICTVLLDNIFKINFIFFTLWIWSSLPEYWSKEESWFIVLFQPPAPAKVLVSFLFFFISEPLAYANHFIYFIF